MRSLALLLGLVLSGTAGALAALPVPDFGAAVAQPAWDRGAGALPRPAAGDGSEAAEGPPVGPHLVLELENAGGEDGEVDVKVEDADSGARLFERRVAVPAGETRELRVALGEAVYQVSFDVVEPVTGPRFWYEELDSRGCPGAFVAGVRFSVQAVGGSVTGGRLGCLVPPVGYDALLQAARAAIARPPGGGALRVGVPGEEDEGVFRVWVSYQPPSWPSGEARPFRWRGDAPFPDAWGRPTRGPELLYSRGFEGSVTAWSNLTVGPVGVPLYEDAIRLEGLPHLLRYLPGSVEALAHTRFSELSATTTPSGADLRYLQELRYAPVDDCMFRFLLQGREVREGARLPLSEVCTITFTLDEEPWVVAGTLGEHRGFRALPLYLLHEGEQGLMLSRWWVAEGMAYFIEEEHFFRASDGVWYHSASWLERLRSEGAPLASGGAPSEAPDPAALGPLDPLRGPALGAARGRFAFPLDEAADAALGNPLLERLQALRARGDAALVGAAFGVVRQAGAPDAGVVTYRWHLVFSARGAEPVIVACSRPDAVAPGPLPHVAVPAASCEDAREPPSWAADLAQPPALGAANLPAEAATFDATAQRWDAANPEARGQSVTRAVYRAWPAPADPDVRGELRVGADAAERGLVTLESAEALSHVILDLATGRTVAQRTGVARVTGLAAAAPLLGPGEALQPARANLVGALAAPELLAAAVGIAGAAGLLALLASKGAFAGLYTRLTKLDVLGQATRSRIYELVAAEPGIHAHAIGRRFSLGHGAAEHHLGILVREGVLVRVATPGFSRYFVAGKFPHGEMSALAALRSGRAGEVYRLVQERPGITLGDLAERAGMNLPAASKCVKRLADAGLLRTRREGRFLRLEALPPGSAPGQGGAGAALGTS